MGTWSGSHSILWPSNHHSEHMLNRTVQLQNRIHYKRACAFYLRSLLPTARGGASLESSVSSPLEHRVGRSSLNRTITNLWKCMQKYLSAVFIRRRCRSHCWFYLTEGRGHLLVRVRYRPFSSSSSSCDRANRSTIDWVCVCLCVIGNILSGQGQYWVCTDGEMIFSAFYFMQTAALLRKMDFWRVALREDDIHIRIPYHHWRN